MNDVMSFGIHRLWKKYYADLLISKYKKTEKILDIASGTGDIFQLLPFKKNLYAIDPIEQMHRVSQEKNADKNIQYQVGYAEKLPYKNNFFQIVSAMISTTITKPYSSAATAMIKSVCASGNDHLTCPSPGPTPKIPPS